MRSIEDIIQIWKHEYGVVKQGRGGSYRSIPFDGKRDLLNDLAQTLKDDGYSEEQIKSLSTKLLVIKACVPPPEANTKKIDLQRKITGEQWADATFEIFAGKTSKYVRDESTAAPVSRKKEFDWTKVEVVPKDMIKVDTTGYAETIYDLEFFKLMKIPLPGQDE